MPRTSTIDKHPKRARINAALVRGAPFRDIARQYDVSKDALSRHLRIKLVARAAATEKALAVRDSMYVWRELDLTGVRLRKLLDACDVWLTDPADATRYSMDLTHPDDITVVYETRLPEDRERVVESDGALGGEQAKPAKSRMIKVRLSELLPMLENEYRTEPRLVELRRRDVREIMLRAMGEIRGHLDLIARIQGQIKEGVTIMVNSPVVLQMTQVILQATRGAPEIRKKITTGLLRLSEQREERAG